MNNLKFRNLTYFILLFLSSLTQNLHPPISGIISKRYISNHNTSNYFLNDIFDSKSPLISQFKNHKQEINHSLALKENLDQTRNLEILSDKQFQEENIIYAEGNVVVTYKGTILKADSLVYDKAKETVNASGNIKLIFENQVFNVERLNYDFKTQKGSFVNVKGLIRTKNLVEDLKFTSKDLKK